MSASLKVVKFEVIGKVQGVFFRKHTKSTCDKHGVAGWVLNTTHGSVQGLLEGPDEAVESVKEWLQKVGSPKSRIEKCTFYEEQRVQKKSNLGFKVVRNEAEVERRTFKTR